MSRPLPRFTDNAIIHDPLEKMLAEREAAETKARTAIQQTGYKTPDPTDLRGIPCLAKGTNPTIRGTDPLAETIRREHHRNLRTT